MTMITFDTYQYIKRLTSSGMDEVQAETLIDAIRDVRDDYLKHAATKEDLAIVSDKLTKEIGIAYYL